MSIVRCRLPQSRRRYRAALQRIELLEPRVLMSVTQSVYTVSGLQTDSAVYDLQGNLWVVNFTSTSPSGLSFDQIDSVNHLVTTSIDLDGISPSITSFVVGKDQYAGHIYFPDNNLGIDDIDLNTQSASFIPLGEDYNHAPSTISQAADGTFWFIGGVFGGNYVGRWVPGSPTVDYTQIPDAVNGTQAFTIVANNSGSAWIGMSISEQDPNDFANDITHKQLAYTTFDGSSFSTSIIPFNTGDVIADTRNYMSILVGDGQGGVWTALPATLVANSPHPNQQSPDSFLHVFFQGNSVVQHDIPITDGSTGVTGSPSDHPGFVTNLALDNSGHLWFSEIEGNNYGVLDTNTDQFTYYAYPEELLHDLDFSGPGFHYLENVAINPTGSEVTFVNIANVFADPPEDTQFLKVSIQNNAPTFTNASASNIIATADTATSLSASFTASAPAGGTYFASISWGDTTTTTGLTVTPGTGNTYTLSYTGKTFSTPGTYNGVITISDLGNGGGTIGFSSVISALFSGSATNISDEEDTPLALSANFTASAPSGGQYLASVHWGDNTPDTAAVVTSLGNDQYSISYSGKVFANPGTYNGTITVSDAAQGGGVIPFSSTIAAIVFSGSSNGINGAEDVAQTLTGMFTAALPASGQYTATINWGNNTPASTGTVMSLGGNDYAVVYQGKVFNVQGTFTGSIVIKDGNATVGQIGFSSVITDTPLVLSTPILVNTHGKFFDLSATFSDDIDSTTTWFTASINWGDSSSSTGVVVADTAHPGQYFVLATHKYKKGTFNVSLTVTSHDEANLVTSVVATTSLIVS